MIKFLAGSCLTRLPLQARPPAKQGEAAWGTSGQGELGIVLKEPSSI